MAASPGNRITAGDSPSIDAFSRWRTSDPEYVFDANFQNDLHPLLFEQTTAQTGAAVTHDTTNRCAQFTFANTPAGGVAQMQTFEHFRYQAGRSQLILATFNFVEPAAGVLKYVGYSDGNNGVEFQQWGAQKQFVLYSDTASGDDTIEQADWNLDKLDGTGPSRIILDTTKTHILVIDLQWLGVGRIRVGFDIDGLIVYAHEFIHANRLAVPYMQTANLPVRAGMTKHGAGNASTTMRFICTSVITEGGEPDIAGYQFALNVTANAGNSVRAHALSIQPLTTFNSLANRSKLILESFDVVVTGNQPVLAELCIGQALSGSNTFTAVNSTYSAVGSNTAGTLSGDPAIVISSLFCAASAQTKGSTSKSVANRYPITLDAAGAARDLGRLTVLLTGLGGTSTGRVALNWREIR